MASTSNLPQLALYHPWPRVNPRPISDWAKTILLFFDGVAILAPPEAAVDPLTATDETIVGPLLERGLLRLLDPGQLMDSSAVNRIVSFLETAAASLDVQESSRVIRGRRPGGMIDRGIGTWDYWPRYGSWENRTRRSGVRGDGTIPGDWGMVYPGRSGTAVLGLSPETRRSVRIAWRELARRGVAIEADDESSPRKLHPYIWVTFEAFLAYLLQPAGLNIGVDLHPATDDLGLLRETMRLLDVYTVPSRTDVNSRAQVISSDLEQVGLDLSRIPLDDVLEFRDRHGAQYREYMNKLRLFMMEIGSMDDLERQDALATRNAELVDAAEDLRRISRTWWRRPVATMGVGIASAVWTASHGDTASVVLSLLGGIVGSAGLRPRMQGPYSYLFEARRSLMH